MLGVVSLRLMQDIATRAAGNVAGWVLVAVVTALGSVGICSGFTRACAQSSEPRNATQRHGSLAGHGP